MNEGLLQDCRDGLCSHQDEVDEGCKELGNLFGRGSDNILSGAERGEVLLPGNSLDGLFGLSANLHYEGRYLGHLICDGLRRDLGRGRRYLIEEDFPIEFEIFETLRGSLDGESYSYDERCHTSG